MGYKFLRRALHPGTGRQRPFLPFSDVYDGVQLEFRACSICLLTPRRASAPFHLSVAATVPWIIQSAGTGPGGVYQVAELTFVIVSSECTSN